MGLRLRNSTMRRVFAAVVLSSVEFFLAILCLISGIPILISPGSLAPASVIALLPMYFLYIWAIGLVVGGLASITGIAFNEYRLERIGVLALGVTSAVFAVALLGVPHALLAAITYGFFSLAMGARYWVLGKLIYIRDARIRELQKECNGDGPD